MKTFWMSLWMSLTIRIRINPEKKSRLPLILKSTGSRKNSIFIRFVRIAIMGVQIQLKKTNLIIIIIIF